jgi:hypothetical protein
MANCVCYMCKRPMDCTGEALCDLCEYDKEQTTETNENKEFTWLSQCCDAPIHAPFEVSEVTFSGFCSQCRDNTVFYKSFY